MSLPTPSLDNRTFQQIVDEVRKRIPLYCPEWTDHNISDPGITLIELFAWMVESLIYRVNQVPELHFIKFMEFLGVERKPPSAAQTRVTFYLTKALTWETNASDNHDMEIQANTRVSTTQTETSDPIIFTTEEAFVIYPPRLHAVTKQQLAGETPPTLPQGGVQQLQEGTNPLDIFTDSPKIEDALWFGFVNEDHDLSYHVLSLKLKFDEKAGIGINVAYPPYVWEAYTTQAEWEKVDVEKDSTKGMNGPGEVILHLPELGKPPSDKLFQTPDGKACHWVRVRVKEISEEEKQRGMRPYRESPRLLQIIQVATIGGAVRAAHVQVSEKELIGVSDGSAGQHFFLDGAPVMAPLTPDERLRVKVNEEDKDDDAELWSEAPHGNFASSQPEDRHYVLNSVNGEVRFGPAVRQPNGEIRRYGAAPARGARLLFERYRYGGGVKGNLQRKALNVLKSSIPYVDRVENREKAKGGTDVEALEATKMRVQWLLSNRHLAITPADYVGRVLDRFGSEIARAHCLALTANQKEIVRVLLIPCIPDQSGALFQGYLDNELLSVDEAKRREIRDYLENYRKLAVQLSVENAGYRRVRVQVKLRLIGKENRATLQKNIKRRLDTYIHPLNGGSKGDGWPFGQVLTSTDIQKRIQNLPGIPPQTAIEIGLQDVTAGEDHPQPASAEISLNENETLISGQHQIEFI